MEQDDAVENREAIDPMRGPHDKVTFSNETVVGAAINDQSGVALSGQPTDLTLFLDYRGTGKRTNGVEEQRNFCVMPLDPKTEIGTITCGEAGEPQPLMASHVDQVCTLNGQIVKRHETALTCQAGELANIKLKAASPSLCLRNGVSKCLFLEKPAAIPVPTPTHGVVHL
jgi:hypothetical protein